MAPVVKNDKRGEVVAAYLRPDQVSELRAIAAREDRSVSQVIRRALEAGLRSRP